MTYLHSQRQKKNNSKIKIYKLKNCILFYRKINIAEPTTAIAIEFITHIMNYSK